MKRTKKTHNGREYEVVESLDGKFYAQTHCRCGSTMGSDWQTTEAEALAEAEGNIKEHEARGVHASPVKV